MPKATKRGSGNKKKRASKRSGKTAAATSPQQSTSMEASATTMGDEGSVEPTSDGLGFGAKSNWIRAQPIEEKVTALRARFAKETGTKLSENLVYAVRKVMKAGPEKQKEPSKKKPAQPSVKAAFVLKKSNRVVSGGVTFPVGVSADDPAQKAKNIRALRSAIFQLGMPVAEWVFADMKKEYYL